MSACSYAIDPDNHAREPVQFFNSASVETLIADYQRTQSSELLGQIVMRCRPIALSLIRSRNTFCFEDERELLSTVDRKLCVSIPQYDQRRGSAFSFISRLTINMLATRVTLNRKLANRYRPLDASLVAATPDDRSNFESEIALNDLADMIRQGVKSVCSDPYERNSQRWYVESFIDSQFEMRRH